MDKKEWVLAQISAAIQADPSLTNTSHILAQNVVRAYDYAEDCLATGEDAVNLAIAGATERLKENKCDGVEISADLVNGVVYLRASFGDVKMLNRIRSYEPKHDSGYQFAGFVAAEFKKRVK